MAENQDITVVTSTAFDADPSHYLARIREKPIRIVAASGDAFLTVMGPAELDDSDPCIEGPAPK